MNQINNIPIGKKIPDDIYGIIEIPAYSSPVKYELHKDYNMLFVDRFIATPMFYPCNYGFINHTLASDGDPLDILIPTPYPIQSQSVIRCKPIGMLAMEDEKGKDIKIIAVPHQSLTEKYKDVREIQDLSITLQKQILYFFENYKNLEPKKWVKIQGWNNSQSAKNEILNAYINNKKK
ncbi:inorganic pyrophosphatase [Buchnera aphidicola (Cinara tujafilina)]|uniref:Inorganic pyrophosphatase n=1 Tax=Buchnera aphidicola (Cinara tujafilina) TaxID=261317 RepID=F7WYZ7_9GAMM|nr:inorganic diphosphatase [Buchnera aphidicola]AEH39647.1 inorganic pyrophosphatase [Buchnera aphidicola (Cinara tujafilina)]